MDFEDDDVCDTRLALGFGYTKVTSRHDPIPMSEPTKAPFNQSSLTLSLSAERNVQISRRLSLSPNSAVLSVSSKVSDDGEEEEEGSERKKLRLTKGQSVLLENKFREHTTLNPKQKQALAKQLNLRPRQVEVWFQNRRARMKLKQTEVDRKVLERCCEMLNEENGRLQKELQELEALKLGSPISYMHLPAGTLTLCPSCKSIGGASHGGKLSS